MLENYNKCVKRNHPDLKVDAKKIMFLRDALAHGRAFGRSDHGSLRLVKFNRKVEKGKVKVTMSVDMTEDWFNLQVKMLNEANLRIAKALDFNVQELGKFSNS